MKKLLALLVVCLSYPVFGQGPSSPCYWSGSLVNCFPASGILLNNGQAYEIGDGSAHQVSILAASPSATYSVKLPAAQGSANSAQINDGTGTLSWVAATTAAVNSTLVERDSTGAFAAASMAATYLQINSNGNNLTISADPALGASANLVLPSTQGSPGQVLQSGGASAMSWGSSGVSQSTLNQTMQQLSSKREVDIVCAAQITLSGMQTCDGTTVPSSDVVLVMGQTDPTEDGIYIENDFGAWLRDNSVSGIQDLPGALICVNANGGGTLYQNTCWLGTGDGGSTATFAKVPVLTSYTSGGIPYFSSASHAATSALLGTNQVVLGGGAGAAPYVASTAAVGAVFQQFGAGASFGAVNLASASAVRGALTSANGGTGLTTVGTNGQALTTAAGAIGWNAINLASSAAVTGTLPLVNGGLGLSTVGTNGQALTTAAGTLGWNAINLASSAAVTGTLPLANGGLGLAVVGTNGQSLTTSAGALGWNAINLASSAAVTGTLPVGNGGTGLTAVSTTNGQQITTSAGAVIWGATELASSGAVHGTLGVANGGTGLTAVSTINGQQLTTSAGAVSWGYTELASSGAVHGTLGTANGGLGVTSGTSNQVFRVPSGGGTFAFGTIYLATGSGVNANPGQVQGTGTSDNAASGNIGEYIESLAGTSSIPGASGAYGEITHITLTPGDWDVTGFIQVLRNGATFSTDAFIQLGIIGVTASGTGMSDGQNSTEYDLGTSNLLTFNRLPLTIPPVRVTVSPTAGITINGTTTSTFIVYLNLYVSTYSVATPTYTARLSARRVR